MKNMKRKIAALGTAALMTAMALNFNACTQQSPLSADSAVSQDLGFTMLKVQNPRLAKAFQTSQWIDDDGGTISVGNYAYGISQLYFPKNAVNDPIYVTFWWESTGFLEGGADFSPHGATFDKPVRVALSYKDADLTGVNEDDLKIYYYHEDTGEWEIIGDTVDKTRQMVIGYTTHFSRYAIGTE